MFSLFLNALANKNEEKELKFIVCTNELKEMKEIADDVFKRLKEQNGPRNQAGISTSTGCYYNYQRF